MVLWRLVKGDSIEADSTILCSGENLFKFLNFEQQLLAKCSTLGHIELTEDGAALLKGMSVVSNLDGGFVFEPDAKNEIKV